MSLWAARFLRNLLPESRLVRVIYGIVCVGAIVGSFLLVFIRITSPRITGKYTESVFIQGKPLYLEIARTPEARETGLSYRMSMAKDQGMLFIMDEVGRHTFWMKDTHFPLDIIWLREGKVVDIATLDYPRVGQFPAVYAPKEAADRVLELNAGMAEEYGISIGKEFLELSTLEK